MPNFPCEFELPDEWWIEAGMHNFVRTTPCFTSKDAEASVLLTKIEPPFRHPTVTKDWNGFDRDRLVRVLSGISNSVDMPPVNVASRTDPGSPYLYRVRDGYHRFYASVAAGFDKLPAIITETPNPDEF